MFYLAQFLPRNARAYRLATFWVCLVGSSFAPAEVNLQVHDVTVNDGKVEFKASLCEPAPAPVASDQIQTAQAETPTYLVTVDLARTVHGSFGYFVYEFFVRQKNASTQGCIVRVQGIPSGTFVDKMANVSFQVWSSGTPEDGGIRIPLYNVTYSKPIVEGFVTPPVASVSLTGESPVEIDIANILLDLPVGLYEDVAADASQPALWQEHKASLHLPRPGSYILQPGQRLRGGISLLVKPNPWRALSASMFPLAPDQPHETVTLSLNYDTPGGIPGTLQIPVPIRFKPSFWSLLLAVLLGSIVGGLLGQLIPRAEEVQATWYRALLVAVLASLLTEALGIILVFGKSQFRLFGFELDPYQLLPVTVIGALVGLYGFRRADDFFNLFKKP